MPRELTMFLTAIPVCQWKENSIVLRNSGSSGDGYLQCCPCLIVRRGRLKEECYCHQQSARSPGMHTTVLWEFNQVIGQHRQEPSSCPTQQKRGPRVQRCTRVQWARYRSKGNHRKKKKMYMQLLEACCYENTRQSQKFIQLRSRKQRPVALMTPYQSSLIDSVGLRTPRGHDQQQQQIGIHNKTVNINGIWITHP